MKSIESFRKFDFGLISKKNQVFFRVIVYQVLGAGLAVAVQMLLARNTTVNTFGRFGVLFNIVNIIVLVALMGSPDWLLRYASINTHSILRKSKFLSFSLSYLLNNWVIISLLLIPIVFLTGFGQYNGIEIVLSFLLIILLGIVQSLQNFSRASGKFFMSIAPNTILRSLLVILGVLLLILNKESETLSVADILLIFSIALLIINAYALYSSRLFLTGFNILSIEMHQSIWRRCSGYFKNTVGQNLLKNLDIVLVGFFLSSYDAGIYSAANRINMVALFGLSSFNILFGPKVAMLYQSGQINKINQELRSPSILVFGYALMVLMAVIFFGKYILNLFGSEYIESYLILIILSIRNLVESIFGITGSILNMTGNQGYFNKVVYIVLLIFIIVSPLSLYFFGLLYFALSLVLIALIKNLLQWRFITNQLGIRTGLVSFIQQ